MPKHPNKSAPEILTLDEVSAYLQSSKRTVYRLAQGGVLPAFKLGGSWRFRRSELERWIANAEDAARGGRIKSGPELGASSKPDKDAP